MVHDASNRVPPIVLAYWVIKIAATTLGETGADHFSMTLDLGYGSSIAMFGVLFGVLLGAKLWLGRYSPTAYWAVFTASAILGTVVSDFIDRTLGIGYLAGSGLLLALLLGVLGLWFAAERSLSVEHVQTSRVEIWYWTAFLVANTLGTAAGDLLADDLGIGFMASAGVIAALLGITALAHYTTRVPSVVLFWIAFVLTRPFGATFGDLLTKSADKGGLDLGTLGASVVFVVVMAVALWRESVSVRRGEAA
jgi:uncharacterized membrane-anchored protein